MGCLKLDTYPRFASPISEQVLTPAYKPTLNIVHKKEQAVLEPTLNVVHRKEEQLLILTEVVVVVFENRLTSENTVYIARRNIQDPYNTMSYDRFGYVWNNPLMNTDPSGEWIWIAISIAVKVAKIVSLASMTVNTVVAIARGANIAQVFIGLGFALILGKFGAEIASGISGLLSSASDFVQSFVGGFVGGFALGVLGAAMTGASFKDALKSGLIGGAIAGTIAGLSTKTPGGKVQANKQESGMADKNPFTQSESTESTESYMKGVKEELNDVLAEGDAKLLKEAMSAKSSTLTEVKKGLTVLNSPVGDAPVSSAFGVDRSVGSSPHNGTDYPVPVSTKVVSTAKGVAVRVYRSNTYGKTVIINHGASPQGGGDVYTLYAHGSELNVNVGQSVEAGQQIMLSGNTGISTAPHLHYEVIRAIHSPFSKRFFNNINIRYSPKALSNLLK